MHIENPKVGGLIRINGQVGEIVEVSEALGLTVKTANKAIFPILDCSDTEPIFLDKELVTKCCGFGRTGVLKVPLDNEHVFYLKENKGHVILLGKDMEPLIHFWEVRTLHQLQGLYSQLTGKRLDVSMEQLNIFFSINQ